MLQEFFLFLEQNELPLAEKHMWGKQISSDSSGYFSFEQHVSHFQHAIWGEYTCVRGILDISTLSRMNLPFAIKYLFEEQKSSDNSGYFYFEEHEYSNSL